jgi:hypothetical protein
MLLLERRFDARPGRRSDGVGPGDRATRQIGDAYFVGLRYALAGWVATCVGRATPTADQLEDRRHDSRRNRLSRQVAL